VYPYPSACDNCAVTTGGRDDYERGLRGGSYFDFAEFIETSGRDGNPPWSHLRFFGARCARSL
jgi:formylglycine-generating enzyme required for sulfatase activity